MIVRVFLLFIGLLLSIFQHFMVPVSIELQMILLIAGVIVLGVPHGAADMLVASKNAIDNNKHFSSGAFHINYILRMVLFGCLFWLSPVAGYILFILFAGYHFGETDLNKYQTNKWCGKMYVTCYGLVILSVILLTHLPQVRVISGSSMLMDQHSILFENIERLRFIIVQLIVTSFLVFSSIYFSHHRVGLRTQLLILGQFAVLVFILYHLPVIAGFLFYFLAWHSILSLKYIIAFLRNGNTISGRKIAGQIALYSILAIAIIVVLAVVGLLFFDNSSPTVYVFLGLAILTAPHMHVMGDMYENMRLRRKQENIKLIQT